LKCESIILNIFGKIFSALTLSKETLSVSQDILTVIIKATTYCNQLQEFNLNQPLSSVLYDSINYYSPLIHKICYYVINSATSTTQISSVTCFKSLDDNINNILKDLTGLEFSGSASFLINTHQHSINSNSILAFANSLKFSEYCWNMIMNLLTQILIFDFNNKYNFVNPLPISDFNLLRDFENRLTVLALHYVKTQYYLQTADESTDILKDSVLSIFQQHSINLVDLQKNNSLFYDSLPNNIVTLFTNTQDLNQFSSAQEVRLLLNQYCNILANLDYLNDWRELKLEREI